MIELQVAAIIVFSIIHRKVFQPKILTQMFALFVVIDY